MTRCMESRLVGRFRMTRGLLQWLIEKLIINLCGLRLSQLKQAVTVGLPSFKAEGRGWFA